MSSTNKFPNGLNNWELDDKPKWEDFVEDNRILDTEAMWKKEYDLDGKVAEAGGIEEYVAANGGGYSDANGNTAAGTGALRGNTNGENNTANGFHALYSNTTGNYNTAIGASALCTNTTGNSNTGNGYYSLFANETGNNNVANGFAALRMNVTGNNNTSNGFAALFSNTTGEHNTANGMSALYANTTGRNNIANGYNAGRYLANGSTTMNDPGSSIFIGASSRGSASDSQTNQIVVGYNTAGNGSNTITLGNSSITGLYCQVTAITQPSDSRLKEDIEGADLDLCYADVKRLPVTRYKYKNFTGVHTDSHVTGFMADDVEGVFPKSVSSKDQYYPVLDEVGRPVFEEITETVTELDEQGNEVTKEVARQVEQMFLLQDVKDITMTEAVPTLWGAVQKLMEKVEHLEEKLAKLEKKKA